MKLGVEGSEIKLIMKDTHGDCCEKAPSLKQLTLRVVFWLLFGITIYALAATLNSLVRN